MNAQDVFIAHDRATTASATKVVAQMVDDLNS